MLGNIDLEKLSKAKNRPAEIKNFKLAAVAQKHVKDKYEFCDLVDHINKEVQELEHAISQRLSRQVLQDIEIEIADISNMCDLMCEFTERLATFLERGQLHSKDPLSHESRCQCPCGCHNKVEPMEDLCHFCLEHHEELRRGQP
jgi:hypothetical protein